MMMSSIDQPQTLLTGFNPPRKVKKFEYFDRLKYGVNPSPKLG